MFWLCFMIDGIIVKTSAYGPGRIAVSSIHRYVGDQTLRYLLFHRWRMAAHWRRIAQLWNKGQLWNSPVVSSLQQRNTQKRIVRTFEQAGQKWAKLAFPRWAESLRLLCDSLIKSIGPSTTCT